MAKPIIGVAHCWTETMPCNWTHRALAQKVKEGVRRAGGTPMEFNTIAISDGITMGTPGMKTSLVSREVIADSIELVARAHLFDAIVAIAGCDKTIPGSVMALARLDVPAVLLYSGSIPPGHWRGAEVTIQEVFEAVGAHAAGKLSDDDVAELERAASPGAGACGGQFTANTMAMAFEVLGMSPMGSAMVPAQDGAKGDVAIAAGELVMDVLARGQRPARSSRARGSRTRSPPSRAAAARPTACCICSPSRAKPASRSSSTTSIASPRRHRSSAISSPAAASSPPISTRRGACRWSSSGSSKAATSMATR